MLLTESASLVQLKCKKRNTGYATKSYFLRNNV